MQKEKMTAQVRLDIEFVHHQTTIWGFQYASQMFPSEKCVLNSVNY